MDGGLRFEREGFKLEAQDIHHADTYDIRLRTPSEWGWRFSRMALEQERDGGERMWLHMREAIYHKLSEGIDALFGQAVGGKPLPPINLTSNEWYDQSSSIYDSYMRQSGYATHQAVPPVPTMPRKQPRPETPLEWLDSQVDRVSEKV